MLLGYVCTAAVQTLRTLGITMSLARTEIPGTISSSSTAPHRTQPRWALALFKLKHRWPQARSLLGLLLTLYQQHQHRDQQLLSAHHTRNQLQGVNRTQLTHMRHPSAQGLA